MKQLIEDQVNDEELEELYGGSGSDDCMVRLNCTIKVFSDEDSEENVIF